MVSLKIAHSEFPQETVPRGNRARIWRTLNIAISTFNTVMS